MADIGCIALKVTTDGMAEAIEALDRLADAAERANEALVALQRRTSPIEVVVKADPMEAVCRRLKEVGP